MTSAALWRGPLWAMAKLQPSMSESFLAAPGTWPTSGETHNKVVRVEVHLVVVIGKQRQRGEVVHRDVEEALDLTLVQVKGDDAVDAGGLKQVGDQTGGDGLARAGLAILAGVAVVGDNRGDGASGSALGGIGGDEELHQHIVDVSACDGLGSEHIGAGGRSSS